MKLLSDILLKDYAAFMSESQLPSFEEDETVCAIMNDGTPEYCNTRTSEGIKCPMCGNTLGYKVRNHDELWWACRRNECIQRNANNQKKTNTSKEKKNILSCVGVPARLQSASFSDWKHSQNLLYLFQEYAHAPNDSLLLMGKNGIGKSYSACAILKNFYQIHKEVPVFINISELYQEWLNQQPNPRMILRKLTTPSLIVLDDLGIRTPTEAFLDFLYIIINSRYASMKGTIITTNLTVVQLEEKFGKAIVSRLLSGKHITMEGKDLRTFDVI